MATPTPRQFLQWYRDRETEPSPKADPAMQADRVPMAEWLLAHIGLDREAAFEQYLEEIEHGTTPAPFRFAPVIAREMLAKWRAAR